MPAVAARRPDRASRAFGLPPPRRLEPNAFILGAEAPRLRAPHFYYEMEMMII